MTVVFLQDTEIDSVILHFFILFGALVLFLTEKEDLSITVCESTALEKIGLFTCVTEVK